MARKTDKERIVQIIQMLSVRKKQFVSVPVKLYPKLTNELRLNYPWAKFKLFGIAGGRTINCIRVSTADTFKNHNN